MSERRAERVSVRADLDHGHGPWRRRAECSYDRHGQETGRVSVQLHGGDESRLIDELQFLESDVIAFVTVSVVT